MSSRRTDRLRFSSVISHLWVMVVVSAVMGVLVAGLAIPFAGVAGLGARTVADSMSKLPEELTAEPLPQRTRMVARDGTVLATFYDQNRVNVSLDQVAPIMRKAIVAIEDYRFYQHGALDVRGTLRAFVTNQASNGVVQGGSSITQQMVKMTLINQADTKKEMAAATADTYERKINELRYAIAFEQQYSKDWILERYLNIAYFGDGAYGIQAAARHYFSKSASELNLREAALLAGLVKNPTGYDPTNDPSRARARRDVVINRMAELNVITPQKAEATKRKGLGLHITPTRNGCVSSAAPFFCQYAIRYLLQDPALGKTEQDRAQMINTGGLTIKTTIDLRYQRAAAQSVHSHVYPTDRAIGALAMVEPGTGEVRALAQSRPMGSRRGKGETYLNYTVPARYGDANGFQAGSTFKVFVLAAAIKQGIPLSTQINAPQTISIQMNRYKDCHGNYPSTQYWTPSNSTGAGTFNLYTGTQLSVNTFFAQLELRTGLCEPYKLAKEMGITLNDPKTQRVPAFTLGIVDTNPLEMAGAYATFAARGLHCDPRPVTEVLSRTGKVLVDYPKKCQQVLPRDVADAVNDILRGVQQPGGFGYEAGIALNQPSAGKTGTINGNRAVWFVGYTPNLATASMLAGADRNGNWLTLNGQTIGGQYVSTAHGSTNAGPIWGDAMQVIQQWLPNAKFHSPNPQTIKGQMVTIPEVGGMNPQQAANVLRSAGFNPVIGPMVDSSYSYGTVAYLSPSSGTTLGSGSTVTIYVSDGSPYVPPSPSPQGGNGGGGGGTGGGGGGTGGGGGGGTGGGTGGGPGNGNGGGPPGAGGRP
ncbi:MAG TPA: transglycosylase domain-containing protein [Nocardioidaceae bacterium]|jgi:membrane peptidoglycan carboxypeptidase